MALLNPTFLLGVVLLLYLSTFVLFAILRILTGISIQRVGYFSLRRLAYTPKDGTKVEIRGLGLNIHRPTFSQPTWLSIVLSELAVTIDPKELEAAKTQHATKQARGVDEESEDGDASPTAPLRPRKESVAGPPRSQIWKKLAKLKDRVKRLHRNVHWLRLVDVVATDSTVSVVGVGKVQLGNFTVALDTRHRMVDRARFFFQGAAEKKRSKTSAEWIVTLRSVLFTAKGSESVEVLDAATLNVHGFLYEQLDGLRDAAIALKLGRVHIPYDDVLSCASHYRRLKATLANTYTEAESIPVFKLDKDHLNIEDDQDLLLAVADSREFFSSILRGIKEVQFAVSFVSLNKRVDEVRATGTPVLLNTSMKEVGIDLHRLDPKSPAHRMYFPTKDIAHEAQAVALSITVGLDDGSGTPEKIVYVPMATTTLKTTLPSKTVELAQMGTVEQRNANILFANSVVTSPSVDLEPKHLPILLAILRPKPKKTRANTKQRYALISRMLPKANIKFTMHEPVIRIALPPVTKTDAPDDYDLINSTISSISLDLESFHPTADDLHYSLISSMRVQTHQLYYQTTQGDRYDLLETESFDLKLQVSANPDVHVVGSGHLQTFAIRMTRDEISDGIRQIIRQLRLNVQPDKRYSPMSQQDPKNILRSLPPWLLHFTIQINDFSAEIAGIDEDFPGLTRGVAIQADSWSAEYRAQKIDTTKPRPSSRRRAPSRVLLPDADLLAAVSVPPSPRKHQAQGDGRRIAIHVRGLEGFIIESEDKLELDPFIRLPRFEVALSTLSDAHSPILHVHSYLRTLHLQYSLFRHYSVGIAVLVLRKAFMRHKRERPQSPSFEASAPASSSYLAPPSISVESPVATDMKHWSQQPKELVAIDFKAAMIQLKADMPSDPPLMLRIHDIEAGRHRWSPPFFYAKNVRLYADAPRMPGSWARVAIIRTIRFDYRESRKKMGSGAVVEDKMFDVVTDAVRLSVPHELIINKISNNIVNVMKSTRQLHHRFKTGTNEYILNKEPEGAKRVPKVSLRVRKLLFEIEDGAFEFKLGMIYRAGRIEQRQRLAREDAYRLKVKKIHEEELRKESNRLRNRSAMPRGRQTNINGSGQRSQSAGSTTKATEKGRSASVGYSSKAPRYDPDKLQGMSGSSRVSVQEARTMLHIRNAESWRHRIQRHYAMASSGMEEIRSLFLGADTTFSEPDDPEHILDVPPRPALAGLIVTDLHFMVDKPSFPLSKLPDFLHEVGKGMPKDMKYSLLVPMHVNLTVSEARLGLRDYPLPLIHVPALKNGQSSKLHALSLSTDFVIAEEFRSEVAARSVTVQITPPTQKASGEWSDGFAIDVRRTIGPVKSFSDMQIDINTANPTRITWGPSYQPAIQDMMMGIESFTKPQFDPSERVGFWDKIRLNFHSRVRVAWKEHGDVHFALKGSRDPYNVTGNGAGFLMCWRKDVRWNINTENDPKRFMLVDSGEYVMAIPDYGQQVREAERRSDDNDSVISDTHQRAGAAFKKVAMKLSGNVQWMAGLVFERALDDVNGHKHRGGTSFDFKPHYDVVLKSPQQVRAEHAKASDDNYLPHDAYRGFRSQHIHLSVAIKAPSDRDWSSPEARLMSKSYNSIHLTPRFFTHFFAWWSLFGGPMSLPIRQGSLWPDRDQKSKKFGRHLATIKYNILLAPLFLSHIYKHKDAEDYTDGATSATGIKVRFDSFMLDIHQRREEFNTRDHGRKTKARTTGMKIHAAQLDLVSTDIRAVSSALKGTSADAIRTNKPSNMVLQGDEVVVDLSNFTIPDDDYSWIDMDDFVELDWILPNEINPETKILPLAYAPRVTYFRQTDIGGVIDGDPDRTSPFGDEPTHFCIMTHDDNPRKVQADLIETRLAEIGEQMENNIRRLGETELHIVRGDGDEASLKAELESLSRFSNVLQEKQTFMKGMLSQMQFPISTPPTNDSASTNSDAAGSKGTDHWIETGDGPMQVPSGAEFASDFKNRFVVHNMQLKWNNLLRNIILRYSHQVSQRRGFVYYMSRPAVKFILDIVEDQAKAKQNAKPKAAAPDTSFANSQASDYTSPDIESLMSQVLQDGRKFVDAESGHPGDDDAAMRDLANGLADEFAPQSSYHVRLIAPQIQLQSEKNKKHVVLVTGKGMELKIVEVMEKARLSDNVSGLVQRRFLLSMDSAQFFVTHQKWFTEPLLGMYSANKYGTASGLSWPPWVPMEVMFDFKADPFGFKRVVQKTSALLRYDKYNNLRLKYNDEVNTEATGTESLDQMETRLDNLSVVFPQVRAICNSSQYYAMYMMVLDLLMYNEPLEKSRTERLEKIMLASDFSDLRGAPEMVSRLQDRIRVLEEIKARFQIHSKHLDKKGWEDRMTLERDLVACEDELFFMMSAITRSQRKYDTADEGNALLRWSLRAREIVWHLIRDSNEPLVELQLRDTHYDRTDYSDASHKNLLQVGRVLGLNLLPDAIYPQMVAPYFENEAAIGNLQKRKMITVYWEMLEAVAGIPVMDQFEVDLFPMKIQLERELGKKLFEYIFPGMQNENPNAEGDQDPTSSPASGQPNWTGDDSNGDTNVRLGTANSDHEPAFATRAGSLELRLRPTLNSETPETTPAKPKAIRLDTGDGHHFRLFSSKTASKKPSHESLRTAKTPGMGIKRSATGSTTNTANGDNKKPTGRFVRLGKPNSQEDEPSDDLTMMIKRANTYVVFAQIRAASVVLCLSYKGKGERNIEDVHDLVFRLPMIQFHNKTWSTYELALAMKSHVAKALLSHAGAIVGNKFRKHRPNTVEQSKLRELATSSVLLSTPSMSNNGDNSDDSSSLFGGSQVDYSRSPPRSIAGSQTSIPVLQRSNSRSSSVASSQSYTRPKTGHDNTTTIRGIAPSWLTMTPPTPQDRPAGVGFGTERDRVRPQTSGGDLRSGRLGPSPMPSPITSEARRGTHVAAFDGEPGRDRRKSAGGGGFLKGKFKALTSRVGKDRESSTISSNSNSNSNSNSADNTHSTSAAESGDEDGHMRFQNAAHRVKTG